MPGGAEMEGILLKWTNYFSGWQPRWFILNQGILSYFKSKEDIHNGCKGSISMAVCDVNVHPTDLLRLDLFIPGEAYFYVRAPTEKDRQAWLVALGSCKIANQEQGTTVHIKDNSDDEFLKLKRSELRLYCDLLTQTVHSIREAVQVGSKPNTILLVQNATVLQATCDTFIETLDECMTLSKARPCSPLISGPQDLTGILSPTRRSSKTSPFFTGTPRKKSAEFSRQRSYQSRTTSESSTTEYVTNSMTFRENNDAVSTFFSQLAYSFKDVPVNGKMLSTSAFLDACQSITPIFDKLNHTAFAPVRLDYTGNIKKLLQKLSTNPDAFLHLQNMIKHEVQHKQHYLSNSATLALLWLKRGLEFILCFIEELLNTSSNIETVASVAYAKSLKPFHSFVIQGVFRMTLNVLPSRDELMQFLGHNSVKEELVRQQMSTFSLHLGHVISLINQFYEEQGLNLDEKI